MRNLFSYNLILLSGKESHWFQNELQTFIGSAKMLKPFHMIGLSLFYLLNWCAQLCLLCIVCELTHQQVPFYQLLSLQDFLQFINSMGLQREIDSFQTCFVFADLKDLDERLPSC